MCGIAGYVDLWCRHRVEAAVIESMTATLTHRGPDSCGFFVEPDAGLGFRRLKIVDLETGDQPLYSEDGNVVVVCNGEIFNYPQLHRELCARGHRFKTRSDVEVLVHLYEDHGCATVDKLNGQFGLAIYDRRAKRLLLARDHFGVNPLFFAVVDGLLIFGSEIKAILAHPSIEPRVDLVGLDQILSFPGLVSPRTVFEGIQTLPTGHLGAAGAGVVRVRVYWYRVFRDVGAGAPRREEEYTEELGEIFERSVRRRLLSDVPVGLFVSGGLDSSLVAAVSGRCAPETRRRAFSVTFADPELDEAGFQRLAARELGFELHESRIDDDVLACRLTEMIRHCECPVKESFDACILVLAEAAKSRGISVVLAGQGADELFGGYVGYRFDSLGERKNSPLQGVAEAFEEELRERLWGNRDLFYEKDLTLWKDVKLALYSPAVRERFETIDCLNHPLIDKERLRNRHVLHQRSYLDFKLRLADHLLSDHGDRMVMAHAVEARYPFLDVEMVEYASRIPAELMIKNFQEKYLVRRMADGLVPPQILGREKFGFFSPGSPLLLQQARPWVLDLLSRERIQRQGYFDPDAVERLKQQYSQPGFHLHPHLETDLLMVVLTFNLLCELFHLPGLD